MLPLTLNETYHRILYRISCQSQEKVVKIKRLLQWLTCLTMPLYLAGAAEASVIDPEVEFKTSDRLIDPHLISDPCSSLVVINRDKLGREVIKLAHPSVQRYLCSTQLRESETPVSQFAISDVDANVLIVKSCFRYLQYLSHPVSKPCSPAG